MPFCSEKNRRALADHRRKGFCRRFRVVGFNAEKNQVDVAGIVQCPQ